MIAHKIFIKHVAEGAAVVASGVFALKKIRDLTTEAEEKRVEADRRRMDAERRASDAERRAREAERRARDLA